ncbi:MAG: HlyD family secretion protein [Chthonomonadales bacterium]|nr:HlyD family secretion protein [Chthonomonadales bacterium]
MTETRPASPQSAEEAGANGAAPAGDASAPALAKPARPWLRPLALIAAVIALGIGTVVGYRYWRFSATHVSTDNASVSADLVRIAPQVSGTVTQVLVSDNQQVKPGELLVVLDDAPYRAAVAQARANLEAARAQARGAGVSVGLTAATGTAQQVQAQGLVGQAESGVAGAAAEVARSAAVVTSARASAASAGAGVTNARGALEKANADRQQAVDAVAAARAQVDTAQAAVKVAQAVQKAAQAAADTAERDAARYRGLAGLGAVSEQMADRAEAAALQANAQVESARQQVAQAESTVSARRADVSAARRRTEAAEAAIRQAKAGVSAAQEQATAARAGVGQALAAERASEQAVSAARARRQQAVGQLAQARTTPGQVAVSRSAEAQAAARIAQARAALDEAELRLGYTRIRAPVAGRVSKKSVEVGALVQPGAPLMALVPLSSLWVTANFKETQLAGIRPGRAAEVTVDAVPGRVFRGHVDSISAGTGATFALLPPDNATGNFTKVVQRVPVKVALEPGQAGMDRLRAGMSAVATVSVP